MLRNSTIAWGSLSRAFHGILGIAVIAMLVYGLWFNHFLPNKEAKLFHRSIHADIGYVILLLMVLRLIWRGLNPVPAPPDGSRLWERALSQVNHWALYVTTIVVALLGWAHSGAHKPDYADWFGLFRVPQFTSENKDNARFFEHWHIWLAYALIGLVVLHFVAALYHRFIKRDRVVARMMSGASSPVPSKKG